MKLKFTLILAVLSMPMAWGERLAWNPTAEEKEALRTRLESQWPLYAGNDLKKGTGVREVAGYLLSAAAVGMDPARLDTLIGWLEKFQQTNRAARAPMNFFWYWGDTEVKDQNAVQFALRQLVFVHTHYFDRLSPEGKKRFVALLKRSVEGVEKQPVKVSYTNIFLKKIFNLILLGEMLGLPDVADSGYRALDEWLAFTWENGVSEYLSPTYYAVDLENLALIAHFAGKPEGRAAAEKALIYMWDEVLLNWYGPGSRLGGAHSRDYDRLTGQGMLDAMVQATGYLDGTSQVPPNGTPFERFSFWAPPASALSPECKVLPRFIRQRWNRTPDRPFETADQYLGASFSIGSATANYWDMDKGPLVATLGGGEDTPSVVFVMDGRRDYYGKVKTMESSGHMKSLHLKPFCSSVQKGPEVLFFAAAAAKGKDYLDTTATFTLPLDAEFSTAAGNLAMPKKSSTWASAPAPDGKDTLITVQNRDGFPVVEIVDRNPAAGVGFQKKIPVQPGRTYRQSMTRRGGALSLYLNWLDASGNRIGGENIQEAAATEGWAPAEQKQVAPPKAAFAVVWYYSKSGATTEVALKAVGFDLLDDRGAVASNLARFDFVPSAPAALRPVASGETVFVRRGGAALALRPLLALDPDGREVGWSLVADGIDYGAVRLTAVLDPAVSGRRVVTAAWALAAEGLGEKAAFDAWKKQILGWKTAGSVSGASLTVSGGSPGAMMLRANLDEEKVLERSGGTPGLQDHLLSVNGREVGRPILADLPAVKAALAGHKGGRFPETGRQRLDATNWKGTGIPEGWVAHFPPNGSTTRLALEKADDRLVLALSDEAADAGVGIQQTVPVTPGKRYVFKAKVEGEAVLLYLNWLDEKKKPIAPENQAACKGGSGTFAPVEISGRADARAAYAQVWFYSSKSMKTRCRIAEPSLEEMEN